MITLVAILCHSLTGIPEPVCVDEVVPTPLMAAGMADDPLPIPFTWVSCSVSGQQIVADWMLEHPIYRSWQLKAWQCVPGQYVASKRA
jgi:hypothetical protein